MILVKYVKTFKYTNEVKYETISCLQKICKPKNNYFNTENSMKSFS